MLKTTVARAIAILCMFTLLLSACTPAAFAPAPATAAVPAEPIAAAPTDAPTEAPTLPPTVTATLEPTLEPTPAPTETPAFTPTATPVLTASGHAVGKYATGGCIDSEKLEASMGVFHIKFCVWFIEILQNGKMRVTASYEILYNTASLPGYSILKPSDDKNRGIYLVDNLGNRYDHSQVGGEFITTQRFFGNRTIMGWYLFPEPRPDATSFTMVHKGFYLGQITNMLLTNPMPLTEQVASLKYHAYNITYNTDIWKLSQGAAGELILTNIKNEKCQMTERAPGEPEGKLKSSLPIGQATFDIYGWLETDHNMGYRDYMVKSGLAGYDPAQALIMRVAIPLDDQNMCLDQAGGILYTLTEPEEE